MSTASPSHGGARVLKVGDAVVYAAHGVGKVVAREKQKDIDGAARDCFVVELVRGLRVTLPVEGATDRLRAVADESEIEEVGDLLAAEPSDRDGPWPQRLRESKSKLAGGCVADLAELVRDGAIVEGPGSRARLSQAERRLYVQARELLAQEIAWVRGIEVDEAEAWIEEQIAVAERAGE